APSCCAPTADCAALSGPPAGGLFLSAGCHVRRPRHQLRRLLSHCAPHRALPVRSGRTARGDATDVARIHRRDLPRLPPRRPPGPPRRLRFRAPRAAPVGPAPGPPPNPPSAASPPPPPPPGGQTPPLGCCFRLWGNSPPLPPLVRPAGQCARRCQGRRGFGG